MRETEQSSDSGFQIVLERPKISRNPLNNDFSEFESSVSSVNYIPYIFSLLRQGEDSRRKSPLMKTNCRGFLDD